VCRAADGLSVGHVIDLPQQTNDGRSWAMAARAARTTYTQAADRAQEADRMQPVIRTTRASASPHSRQTPPNARLNRSMAAGERLPVVFELCCVAMVCHDIGKGPVVATLHDSDVNGAS